MEQAGSGVSKQVDRFVKRGTREGVHTGSDGGEKRGTNSRQTERQLGRILGMQAMRQTEGIKERKGEREKDKGGGEEKWTE